MDRQAKIDFILDHYENPRNFGALDDFDAMQRGGNPGCGDILTMYLKTGADGRVERLSFEGEGCTISQAAASMVTEMLTGKSLEEVEGTSPDAVIGLIGREIAATRLKCATLALETTKAAVRNLRIKQAGVQGAGGK